MNVLVYRSQLSTVLGEPVDLDQKQGTHQVGSPTFPLSHRLRGQESQGLTTCQE